MHRNWLQWFLLVKRLWGEKLLILIGCIGLRELLLRRIVGMLLSLLQLTLKVFDQLVQKLLSVALLGALLSQDGDELLLESGLLLCLGDLSTVALRPMVAVLFRASLTK